MVRIYMSRSRERKVQRTTGSVERGHMDRILINKEAELALLDVAKKFEMRCQLAEAAFLTLREPEW